MKMKWDLGNPGVVFWLKFTLLNVEECQTAI